MSRQDTEVSVMATGMLVAWIFVLGIVVGTMVEKRERERREMVKRLDKLDPPKAPEWLMLGIGRPPEKLSVSNAEREKVGAHANGIE